MDSPPPKLRSRVAYFVRALVRQLAAAVYVIIALAFLTQWLGGHLWLEPGLTVLGGLIVGAIISGPWWTTHLVGLFVGLIQVTIAIIAPAQTYSKGQLAVWATLSVLFGALGARITTWRKKRAAT